MPKNILTQERLKELLHYNPETGVFTWRHRVRSWFASKRACSTWNTRYAGAVAGCTTDRGYVTIKLFYVDHKAHRLAFLYMTGVVPEEGDHENHVRDDNRWSNLRSVKRGENNRNQSLRSDNTTGVVGVTCRKDWFHARIHVKGREKYLGRYATIAEAAAVRRAAERKYGYHVNHGK